MKILIGIFGVIFSFVLFLPKETGAPIRNLPLLIAVLVLVFILLLIRFLKYVALMLGAKRILHEKGFQAVKCHINPFVCRLRGRYMMTFQRNHEKLDVLFLVRRWRYPHYFFDAVNRIEFYVAHRMVYPGGKTRGVVMARQSEVYPAGRRELAWKSMPKGILLFDKLPNKVTDSVRKEELGCGDAICASEVRLYDLNGLKRKTDFFI